MEDNQSNFRAQRTFSTQYETHCAPKINVTQKIDCSDLTGLEEAVGFHKLY
jgi:hypothetical protein